MPHQDPSRRPFPGSRRRRTGIGFRSALLAAIAASMVGCTGRATPTLILPTVPTGTLPPAATPRPTPTPPAADAGWIVRLNEIEEVPGRTGYTNIDATMWLVWQGPGSTHVPAIASSVTSPGSVSALQPTVYGGGDQIVPAEFAVTAEVQGEYPANLAAPVLNVYSDVDSAFHAAAFPLGGTIEPGEPPAMPAPAGSGVLDVAGRVQVTPSILTVFHSLDGVPSVVAQHGDAVLQYGGSGDFWEIAAAVAIRNVGTQDLSLERLSFELFDSTWAFDTPDIRVDPVQSADTVAAGATVDMALSFDMDNQPKDLRLVMAWINENGVPTTTSVTAYGPPEISAGDQTFQDLLTAVDTYQESCRAKHSAGPTIGTSDIDFAAATSTTEGVVHATDTLVDPGGSVTGASDDTYVLARVSDAWAVTSMTSAAPDAESPATTLGC